MSEFNFIQLYKEDLPAIDFDINKKMFLVFDELTYY